MGEKEEVKATYMTAFAENSIRAIVERANELEIKRENIVQREELKELISLQKQ